LTDYFKSVFAQNKFNFVYNILEVECSYNIHYVSRDGNQIVFLWIKNM